MIQSMQLVLNMNTQVGTLCTGESLDLGWDCVCSVRAPTTTND